MQDTNLTQAEADRLLVLEKHWLPDKINKFLDYPALGGKLTIPLICVNKRENFLLDITRNAIALKETKQLRGRQIIPLLRLDTGGSPHRNPDGTKIPSPHLHIYREGYGDKWAIAVPKDKFTNLSDSYQTLLEFMSYCNITQTPAINKVLFT